MNDLRLVCLRQDMEMAFHRGMMDPDTMMQAEVSDLMPEQVELLLQQQQKEEQCSSRQT